MAKASEVLKLKAKNIEKVLPTYLKSREFENVAFFALIDFIKRVQRGLMPNLSKIMSFKGVKVVTRINKKGKEVKRTDTSESGYVGIRKRYESNLGPMGAVNKSNATATGQMLDAMTVETTESGFVLFVDDTFRTKELTGANPKLLNSEVAEYYAKKRAIFDFSKPEVERIVRRIKSDLLDLIRKSN